MKFTSPYLTFLIAVSVKITSTVAFMKSYKIVDDKYHNEQIKRTSSPVLTTFAVLNGPKQHNFDKICAAFKIAIAAKVFMHLLVKNFPKAKKNRAILLTQKTHLQTMFPRKHNQQKENSKLLEKCYFQYMTKHARNNWASRLVRYYLLYHS